MAYINKVKQKEANRERQRRYKAKQKALLNQGVTEGVTATETITFCRQSDIPNYGHPVCMCQHCQTVRTNKSRNIINHGPYKPAHLLAVNEINRVSLPGDIDYTAQIA